MPRPAPDSARQGPRRALSPREIVRLRHRAPGPASEFSSLGHDDRAHGRVTAPCPDLSPPEGCSCCLRSGAVQSVRNRLCLTAETSAPCVEVVPRRLPVRRGTAAAVHRRTAPTQPWPRTPSKHLVPVLPREL